jgi:hypothetical protein
MNQDVSQQQWLTYAYWLEDRGLTAPLPARNLPVTTEVGLTLLPAEPPASPHSEQTQPTDSGRGVLEADTRLVQLLIVTQNLDQEAARGMVEKIALALGLPSEDYRVVTEGKALQAALKTATHLLVFGREGAQLLAEFGIRECALYELRAFGEQRQILLLPHPLVMLAQPQLKIRAWEALQRLKNFLYH